MQRHKWNSFLKELTNLFFFWFFGVFFFFVYKLFFIGIFYKDLSDSVTYKNYLDALFTGFRFDCTAISYFILIPLVTLLLFSYWNKFKLIKNIRIVCQNLFVVFTSIIYLATLNYYAEYRSQFNNFLFMGLFDEDKLAIAKTIVLYCHPVLNVLVLAISITLGILIFRQFEHSDKLYNILIKIEGKRSRVLLVFVFIFLFISSIRGTFYGRPMMQKWAAVTTDSFLNKTIVNPFRSLKYAYVEYQEFRKIDKVNPYGELLAENSDENSIIQLTRHNSKGATIKKPKQIFLVIMESYDSWPLMEEYRPLGLSKNLSYIADNGIHFANFLPAYCATFHAYSTITSGIPYTGVGIADLACMQEAYITSIFSQFKKLGYKTNMFYGGFLSWQNIGNYTEHLKCDKIYSGVDAGGKSESGDWGVEDEKLFNLVTSKLDPDDYSFSVILTSSYHAPYNIDINKKGFMYITPDDFPEEMKDCYDDGMGILEMGHLWYSDWAIGEFIKQAENKYPDALYCFTGDHYGRRFLTHHPDLYERSSVPFILYGKDIKPSKPETPGSHIDIMPTLIEMVAPRDFIYYSFGESMFTPNKKYGIGFNKIITDDFLYFNSTDEGKIIYDLRNRREQSLDDQSFRLFTESYTTLMKKAWHYIVKGNNIP